MPRLLRFASTSLVCVVAAYATYAFVAAGQLPSATGLDAPPMVPLEGRTESRTNERNPSPQAGESADVRDFSYTGRPVPSGYSIK